MKKENNTKGLNGKDLLNVGIFTAVYFVLNLLVAAVLGMIPAVYMLVPFVSSFLLGIPMMLYFMKIKKFGMVLITYIVYGVLLTLAGVGIYSLILGIVFALIAELILRSGKYQKTNRAIFAFALASVGANGNVFVWFSPAQITLKERPQHMVRSICNLCKVISVHGGYFQFLCYPHF